MPVHDWDRVSAGAFHDFHLAWIGELRKALNSGVLPGGYYAQAEQVGGAGNPDALVLEEWDRMVESQGTGLEEGGRMVAVAESPPLVSLTLEAEQSILAEKRSQVTIRHTSGDRIVAFIDIVSPGNKQNRFALERFCKKLATALDEGHHLMVLDVHRPGKLDTKGMHAAFWEFAFEESDGVTPERPLCLAAYCADPDTVAIAYVEPVAIGSRLVQMPLFLTPDFYVNVPLEETYMAAYLPTPARYRRVLDATL